MQLISYPKNIFRLIWPVHVHLKRNNVDYLKKPSWFFFLHIFAIPSSSRHEKCCRMLVRLFWLFQCSRIPQCKPHWPIGKFLVTVMLHPLIQQGNTITYLRCSCCLSCWFWRPNLFCPKSHCSRSLYILYCISGLLWLVWCKLEWYWVEIGFWNRYCLRLLFQLPHSNLPYFRN